MPDHPTAEPEADAPPLAPTLDERALARALSGRHLIGGLFRPGRQRRQFRGGQPGHRGGNRPCRRGRRRRCRGRGAGRRPAQKAWARLPARKRGALVAQCGAVLRAHTEELARLITLETGKAIRTESRIEAQNVADILEFFGGLGGELKGESVPFAPEMLSVTVREPLGVVGAIIPWNVPMLLMALKIAPALVAGNTVVVKSAEEAPLSVLRVAELINRVLPPGCFNILSGFGPECGGPLVAHPLVKKVTFTGSVEVGKIVARAAADKLIPVTLELGGKSPMLVFADCDFERTVTGAITSMRFTRQGQSCTAASRIYVERPIFDRFVAALAARVDAMVMGDPLDEKTDIGTIISDGQFAKVRAFIAEGRATPGATAHICSAAAGRSGPGRRQIRPAGDFHRPAGFRRLVQEEIFGPVTGGIPVRRFRSGAGGGQRQRIRPGRLGLDQQSQARA